MTQEPQHTKSPFKFLDSYGPRDADFFFGREDETEELYGHVNKNRLVLVYGPSGSGKTSLVRCGLANRFDVTDWMPFLIRRGSNINTSLRNTLSNSSAIGGFDVTSDNLLTSLNKMSTRYMRPVYLIFDQFEELLILGSDEERKEFLDQIFRIVNDRLTQAIHLIFIMREEYFARLEDFELAIPSFSDRRMRVEPMKPQTLQKVIRDTCAHFNVTLQKGLETAKQIRLNLRSKNSTSLAYLQIYLDRLWRDDIPRTDLSQWDGAGYPPLTFTTEEIDTLGDIDKVLVQFLGERQETILQNVRRHHPGFSESDMRAMLDIFLSEEGTKRPIYFERHGEDIHLLGLPKHHEIAHLTPAVIALVLKGLEESRLLRQDEDSFELAHDSLAEIIEGQRSNEQRQRRELIRRLSNWVKENDKDPRVLLGEQQVLSFRGEIRRLGMQDRIDAAQLTLLKKSADKVDQERAAKEAAQRKQIATRNRVIAGISGLALIAIVLAVNSRRQSERVKMQNVLLTGQIFDTKYQQARSSLQAGDYDAALVHLDSAKVYASAEDQATLERDSLHWAAAGVLVHDGNALIDSSDSRAWRLGLEKLTLADSLVPLRIIRERMDSADDKIEAKFKEYLQSADRYINKRDLATARILLEEAARLRHIQDWTEDDRKLLVNFPDLIPDQ